MPGVGRAGGCRTSFCCGRASQLVSREQAGVGRAGWCRAGVVSRVSMLGQRAGGRGGASLLVSGGRVARTSRQVSSRRAGVGRAVSGKPTSVGQAGGSGEPAFVLRAGGDQASRRMSRGRAGRAGWWLAGWRSWNEPVCGRHHHEHFFRLFVKGRHVQLIAAEVMD